MKALVAIGTTVRAPGFEVWCFRDGNGVAAARGRIETLARAGNCEELVVVARGVRVNDGSGCGIARVVVVADPAATGEALRLFPDGQGSAQVEIVAALPEGVTASEQPLPAIKESGFASLIDAAVRERA